MEKIILDCDPGHDDAVAILMAGIHPSIELLGITTVAGNQTLNKTTINALNVCQYLNIDVPVCSGMALPMVRKVQTIADDIHGESGLDGPVFDKLTKEVDKRHAVNFIIETLKNSSEKITYKHEANLVMDLVVKDGKVTDLVTGTTYPNITVSGDYMKAGTITLPKSYSNWTYQMIADYNENSSQGIIRQMKFTSNSGKYEECSNVFKLNEVSAISKYSPIYSFRYCSTSFQSIPLLDLNLISLIKTILEPSRSVTMLMLLSIYHLCFPLSHQKSFDI